MATPEENKASALEKAADYRLKASEAAAKGNQAQVDMYNRFASQWDASAARYDGIIAAREKIATAKENIQKIIERRNATPTITYGTPNPNPSGGGYENSGTKLETSTIEYVASQPTPTPPTPTIAPVVVTPPPPPAKTAPIDTVLFNDELVPIEVMTDLIFENIGGQELINIARNDIVNGQEISYSPIKNLISIQQQYNPNNIVSLQSTSDKYFANYSIKLEDKIPNVGSGTNGKNVYIDETTGDLIIEMVNIASDEQVDLQIAISGTIYEADI